MENQGGGATSQELGVGGCRYVERYQSEKDARAQKPGKQTGIESEGALKVVD